MAYERVWQPLAVQGPRVAASIPDAPAYFLWLLAQMLLGRVGTATQGLWTLYGSADNATAGLDATDRWGSTYNATKIPQSATAVGAHGWMILTRTFTVYGINYPVYLLLSNNGEGAACTGACHLTWGLGVPTGGTLTTDPTMTLVVAQKSAVGNVQPDYATDLSNTRRYYGNLSTTGDFWFVETVTGEIGRGALFASPVGCKTNDQFPFFGIFSDGYAAGGTGPFTGYQLFSRAANYSGLPSGRYYNGAVGWSALARPAINAAMLDASDVSLFDFPAYVLTGNVATPTAMHARGRLADMGTNCGMDGTPSTTRPCNIGTAIKDPQTQAIMYVTLNQLIVPYNSLLS